MIQSLTEIERHTLPHTKLTVCTVREAGNGVGYGVHQDDATAHAKALCELHERRFARSRPRVHSLSGFERLIDAKLVRYMGPTRLGRARQGYRFRSLSDASCWFLSKDLLVSAEAEPRPGQFPLSTAGFAAHPDRALAILNAVKELVERHVFFCYWYGDIAVAVTQSPLADFALFDLPNLSPFFVVVAIKKSEKLPGVFVGVGAELRFEGAVQKAIGEAEFFEWWFERMPPVEGSLSSFAGILHMHARSNRGVAARLQCGKKVDITANRKRTLASMSDSIWIRVRSAFSDDHVSPRITVVQAVGAGLIPQHCYTGHDLAPPATPFGFPGAVDFLPLNGDHPLT